MPLIEGDEAVDLRLPGDGKNGGVLRVHLLNSLTDLFQGRVLDQNRPERAKKISKFPGEVGQFGRDGPVNLHDNLLTDDWKHELRPAEAENDAGGSRL